MVTISYDTLKDLGTRARKCNDLEAQVKALKSQLTQTRVERDVAYRQLDCLQSNFDYVSDELGKYDKAPQQHVHKNTPVEAPPPYSAH
jgi:hypothetical protein